MKRTIILPVAAILASSLVMTSCSKSGPSFTPVEINEDYNGPVLGVENWHMEYEDLSWGSISAINVYLINDDTGEQFVAYGGLSDDLCAYLADLNNDGEPELVCNSAWGSENNFRNHTSIFRLNNGLIEIAFPCYGDLEHSTFMETYPDVATDLDINEGNYSDYSDRYDPETNAILLLNSADGTEYEISYECLKFDLYTTELFDESSESTESSEGSENTQAAPEDIEIVYETADPLITPISDIENSVTFYRDGTEIEGKLFLPEGDGPFPVIVLSCGLLMPYTEYEAEARGFVDNGYAAVVFSFTGYSDPEGPQPTNYGEVFLSETRDLYAVMDSLDQLPGVDTANVYLYGHSFGGMVSAFAGCDRSSEVSGLFLVEPAFIKTLTVTYEDGTYGMLRIYDLLAECDPYTVIYMGTHDGYGDDPTSYDEVLEGMTSGELVIIDGADHFFEGEYGEMMVEDACGKLPA